MSLTHVFLDECEEKGSYVWLWQDDHVDQVHPHVGAQGNVSQQLWGLCAQSESAWFLWVFEGIKWVMRI